MGHRRRLLCALAGTLASGMPGHAQAGADARLPRVALLFNSLSPEDMAGPEPADASVRAFVHGLRDLGMVDGRDVVIVRRSAVGRLERLPELVRELLHEGVDLIVAPGAAAVAAAEATGQVPIVAMVDDPGTLVASLARPGGNVTAVSVEAAGLLDGKRLQLLKEMAPAVSRVALITDSVAAKDRRTSVEFERAARALGLDMVWAVVDSPAQFEAAFEIVLRARANAIAVADTSPNVLQRRRIAAFAIDHRLPSVYPYREFVDAGGLMSYGSGWPDLCRRAAAYTAKILRGARPSELPVDQATRYELVINLKTARAIGLAPPASIRLRVDEVIE